MPFTSTPVETVIMDYSDIDYDEINVYIPDEERSPFVFDDECYW